ncbi:unnamed protein product [Trichogramma brassicae]|uniref:Uncharacterized protein n=1 Tax=Trichogramma brassicae TaxID=86971 RepID=A0A6H5I319_9HYME|nr:unnamed protein product [Trichogramma brassicae]
MAMCVINAIIACKTYEIQFDATMAESGGRFDFTNFSKHLDDCVSITKDYSSEQHKFIRKLLYSIVDWRCQLPSLRDFFGREEIEPLLSNSINCRCGGENDQRVERLIDLVARTGYKDEPREVDVDDHRDDKPLLLRRTTPVHHAAKCGLTQSVKDLFKIYDRFDVNYADESGLTHFHVACQYGCRDVVRKFLNLGQDPNCPVDSPLLLALKNNHKEVLELLLRRGADPNTTDEDGSTPLHVICQRGYDDDDATQWFFKICDDVQQTLQVDAKDKSGRTPLQWAVANLLPRTVVVLLTRGADLSSFVFPKEDYFGSKFTRDDKITRRTKCTNYALFVVQSLEKRGYELSRGDALTIVDLLARLGMIRRYSIYTAEVDGEKDDCYKCGTNYRYRPRNRWCCADCLFQMLRRFLRRWAIEFLSTSRCPGLPIHCCEKIVDGLENEDFGSICLAATGQDTE